VIPRPRVCCRNEPSRCCSAIHACKSAAASGVNPAAASTSSLVRFGLTDLGEVFFRLRRRLDIDFSSFLPQF